MTIDMRCKVYEKLFARSKAGGTPFQRDRTRLSSDHGGGIARLRYREDAGLSALR